METDRPRHSKTNADPKTIDLTAETVSEAAAPDAAPQEPETTASVEEPSTPDPVDPAVSDSKPMPSPAPAVAERSSASLIAASVIGGVIALAGAAGLQYWGVLPSLGENEKVNQSLNLVSGDVETLKSSVAALQSAKPEVDLSPVNNKIAAIEARLADVPKANGLSVDADERLSALNKQIAALGAGLDDAKRAEDAARAEIVMRLETLEKKAAEPGDDVAVAVAIASAGLKAAIDRGGPFANELQTLASVKPADPAAKALEPFAASGVPSRAKLLAAYPTAADVALAALRKDDPNQSIADRLLSSAFSAIKVRPVGNVEGESPEAILARVEDRLTNGDLKAAAAEWDKLPAAAKDAAKDYKASLDARIKVEDLVSSTLTQAVRGADIKG